jgi:hypothetical protein
MKPMMTLTPAVLAMGEKFTERMLAALTETELPQDQWYGFVIGWVYGQLRQRMTTEETREVILHVLRAAESQLREDPTKS